VDEVVSRSKDGAPTVDDPSPRTTDRTTGVPPETSI
jgi:hypothetical protein